MKRRRHKPRRRLLAMPHRREEKYASSSEDEDNHHHLSKKKQVWIPKQSINISEKDGDEPKLNTLSVSPKSKSSTSKTTSSSPSEGRYVLSPRVLDARNRDVGLSYSEPTQEEIDEDEEGIVEDDTSDLKQQKEYVFGQIIPVEEDQEHEFKALQIASHPLNNLIDYCEKYIPSFLNTHGGIIYFGVEDDGVIKGIPTKLTRKVRDQLRLRIDALVKSFKPSVDPALWKMMFVPVKRVPKVEVAKTRNMRLRAAVQNQRRSNKKKGNKPEKGFEEEEDENDVEDGNDSSDDDKEEEDEKSTIQEKEGHIERYVIEIKVKQGRAPVYTSHDAAYYRMSGSTHKMDSQMLQERKDQGRPYNYKIASVPRDFIGREEELQMIRKFVTARVDTEGVKDKKGKLQPTQGSGRNIVVVLYGLPTSGKSVLARRLVVEFSSTFPDRQFAIDMKGVVSHYIQIIEAMTSVIRICHPNIQLPENENEIRSIYESCFSNCRSILLIENVGSVEQIKALMPLYQRCLVIVTSRKHLEVDIEIEDSISVRLAALKPNDAVTLLRTIVPSLNVSQAETIAKLCGYLPLAIRVVGSTIIRRPNVTPESLIERLKQDDNRLELVESSFETVFEVQSDEIKHTLFLLSLFPGSFDGPAAAAVFQMRYSDAEDTLGTLLESSFVEFDPVTSRYIVNDLLELYLKKKLQSENLDLTKHKLEFIKHYTKLLREATTKRSRDECIRLFFTERLNLEACLTFSHEVPQEGQSNEIALYNEILEKFSSVVESNFCMLLKNRKAPSTSSDLRD